MRVGVLALQGAFEAHRAPLEALGHCVDLVRTRAQLSRIEGLVIPGGESSAMLKLIEAGGLWGPLNALVTGGAPALLTCAGLILGAARVSPAQPSFGWLDIDVRRNGWGRQVHSFDSQGDSLGVKMRSIRAPRIEAVSEGTRVIERLKGEAVWVQRGSCHGVTFHPELVGELAVHRAAFGGDGPSPNPGA